MQEERITENDIMDVMDVFTQVPVVLLKMAVSRNMNMVKIFESQIDGYINRLSSENMANVLYMPIS